MRNFLFLKCQCHWHAKASSFSVQSLSFISPINRQTPFLSLSSPSHSENVEKLFRYTRGRWLHNEREPSFLLISYPVTILRILLRKNAENDIHYRRFNPEVQARVACEAVLGARSCILFTKLEESKFRSEVFFFSLSDVFRLLQ